jgi:hypothetical protein
MVVNQAYIRCFPSELDLRGRVVPESTDPESRVAAGAFGEIYKGILDNTTLVAIKVPGLRAINNPKCSKVRASDIVLASGYELDRRPQRNVPSIDPNSITATGSRNGNLESH